MIGLGVLALIVAGVWLAGSGSEADEPVRTGDAIEEPAGSESQPVDSESVSVPDSVTAETQPVEDATVAIASSSGLPAIVVAELPDEAIEILGLIDSDGPFKYDKDGATFQNREGLLPDEPRGYYREYTVDTPGAYNRGARRIVGGDDGERYYTADHYSSFTVIVDW